ncbi:hypothetical protein [Psychroserpens sp.]|uniref:hypothetical protein n=1 Tax=Psychroserpens sp. TaxID=2020870 RepID=UPI001B1D1406|nr:hypothetical protein [Psychroserpens sp.]MBO6606689.1 hypothetical protein [Psychroserpens sp.]MBO6631408.1 hypothetical protein [Psychroserpens sp.]MBO6653393.1 hypothetical protein [Psychroserpens sp.]MBO6680580.1 hypothetical protein [Psychroserpens sp.]MBO6750462.1 hypothetical protein [Psychroserpens sp.]
MRSSFLVLSLLCLCSCDYNSKKTKTNTPKVDTLTFRSKGFNSRHFIKLASNNTFVDEERWASCLGGGGVQKIYGKYESLNGKHTFSPDSVTRLEYIEIGEDNTFTEKHAFKYHKDSVIFEMPNIYHLVEWQQEHYLLAEKNLFTEYEIKHDFIKFANYVNSESRGFKLDGRFLTHETKENDSSQSNFNHEQIPKPWQKYFLKEPIRATITDFKALGRDEKDNDGRLWLIEINKGTDHLVYDGLYFSDEEGVIEITTDSILQDKSYGVVYVFNDESTDHILGSELKTKWQ